MNEFPSSNENSTPPAVQWNTLSPHQLYVLLNNISSLGDALSHTRDLLLIDARSPTDYAAEHVQRALNFPTTLPTSNTTTEDESISEELFLSFIVVNDQQQQTTKKKDFYNYKRIVIYAEDDQTKAGEDIRNGRIARDIPRIMQTNLPNKDIRFYILEGKSILIIIIILLI